MGTCEHQPPPCCAVCIDCTLNRVPLQVALIDPGSFRVIDDLLQKEVKGPKKIETMSFAAVEDDGRIE